MKILNVLGFILILALSGCGAKERPAATIDVSAEYPKKDVSFQELGGEIEYLPLETADDVLLEQHARLVSVSDRKIAVVNPERGDIFLFGRDGKIISHFNRKGQGGEEYNNDYLQWIVYDEKNGEVFVMAKKRILVYSETGQFKRKLPFADKTDYTKLTDFDGETLLAYDEFGIHNGGYRTKPYLFISKKDGSIVSELDLNLPKRYSNACVIKYSEGNTATMTMAISLHMYDGDNFIVSNISSDTVYQMTRDKKLTPLLTRIPSVHGNGMLTFFTVTFKTGGFMMLLKSVADFERIKTSGFFPPTELLYRFADGQTTETRLYNADCRACYVWIQETKTAKNTVAALLQADRIVDENEKGKVSGDLKKIAEKLSAEDNQVVMIVKFK